MRHVRLLAAQLGGDVAAQPTQQLVADGRRLRGVRSPTHRRATAAGASSVGRSRRLGHVGHAGHAGLRLRLHVGLRLRFDVGGVDGLLAERVQDVVARAERVGRAAAARAREDARGEGADRRVARTGARHQLAHALHGRDRDGGLHRPLERRHALPDQLDSLQPVGAVLHAAPEAAGEGVEATAAAAAAAAAATATLGCGPGLGCGCGRVVDEVERDGDVLEPARVRQVGGEREAHLQRRQHRLVVLHRHLRVRELVRCHAGGAEALDAVAQLAHVRELGGPRHLEVDAVPHAQAGDVLVGHVEQLVRRAQERYVGQRAISQARLAPPMRIDHRAEPIAQRRKPFVVARRGAFAASAASSASAASTASAAFAAFAAREGREHLLEWSERHDSVAHRRDALQLRLPIALEVDADEAARVIGGEGRVAAHGERRGGRHEVRRHGVPIRLEPERERHEQRLVGVYGRHQHEHTTRRRAIGGGGGGGALGAHVVDGVVDGAAARRERARRVGDAHPRAPLHGDGLPLVDHLAQQVGPRDVAVDDQAEPDDLPLGVGDPLDAALGELSGGASEGLDAVAHERGEQVERRVA